MSFRPPLLAAPAALAVLTAGLMLSAPASALDSGFDDLLELAQATPPSPPGAGTDRRERMAAFNPKAFCLDQVARRAGNRTYLKVRLELKPEQLTAWNAFENYYPGDDVVDSTGVSIYGPQSPIDEPPPSFVDLMDAAYPRLLRMAPSKPIMVYEFGTAAGHPVVNQAEWADEALRGLLAERWPSVRGFAWWNERFQTDHSPNAATEMRLEHMPELAAVFRSHLVGAPTLGDHAPVGR